MRETEKKDEQQMRKVEKIEDGYAAVTCRGCQGDFSKVERNLRGKRSKQFNTGKS